ncbi:hypothetical protein B0H13DRAFT_1960044 [Mycena leptocephala]|nr:hypothetical protein B0H13DRAFT_1960044 [Mycena leptocephala]
MAPTATAVTLWQFGPFRLLQGDSTLPLQPLGTASDGSATTYLYQATNPKLITTDQSGFTTTTTPPRASRTIIASASGWVEPWGTTWAIACNFVNSDFGQCLNINHTSTVTANSGVPTQVVLAVQPTSTPVLGTTTPPESTNTVPIPTSIPIHDGNQPGRRSVGAIVGGVVGGFAAIAILLTLFFFWRRRRLRGIHQEVSPMAYDPIIEGFDNSARPGLERATTYDTAEAGLSTSYYARSQLESTATNPPSRVASNSAASPQAAQRNPVKVRRTEASLGNRGGAPSQTADIPTSELVATLLQRLEDRERWVEQPPPVYET